MAIILNVAAAKKLPHPTEQYGSIQATVSLQGEASSLGEVAAVVRDLFAAAQAGVDQHLAEQAGVQSTAPAAPASVRQTISTPNGYQRPAQSGNRPAPRRGMPGATDSQIRLLRRLLANDEQQIGTFCREQGVASLEAVDVKRASAWIDDLKASGAVPA